MVDLAQTIRAIAAGDHQAFTRLYRAERIALVVLAKGMLAGDHGAAEDVTDAAFMAVWQGASRFAGQSQGEVRAWLRRIVRNKTVDWLRLNGRLALGHEADDALADTGADPEQQALAGDAAARLIKALARLNIDQREAVMLCYFEELSVAQIAAVAACPEGTVKTRLHHARLKLRRELAELDSAG